MTTENLIVKIITLDNLDDYVEIVCNPKVVDDIVVQQDSKQAKLSFANILKDYKDGVAYVYALIKKTENKMIGFVKLEKRENFSAQLSCVIHPNYWNKGYGSEGMLAVHEYAINNLKIKKFYGVCSAFNSSCSNLFNNVLKFEYVSTETTNGKDVLYFEKKINANNSISYKKMLHNQLKSKQ